MFDIEDFFSFLIYILVLFMFLIILSLPRCSLRPEQKLTSDLEKVDRLNSEQQLAEMLKTQLPANLPGFVDGKKGVKLAGKLWLYSGVSDYGKALDALKKNPQLYTSLTYSEFIDRLGFLEVKKEVKNDIFSIATRALFVRDIYPPHIKELDTTERQFLEYPEVYVKYGIGSRFDVDFDADLSNHPILPLDYSGDAVAVIPLTDKVTNPPMATVVLVIHKGILSQMVEANT